MVRKWCCCSCVVFLFVFFFGGGGGLWGFYVVGGFSGGEVIFQISIKTASLLECCQGI